MFTGIVTDVGEVLEVQQRAEGLRRLRIACSYDRASIVDGASIGRTNGVATLRWQLRRGTFQIRAGCSSAESCSGTVTWTMSSTT